MFKRYYHCFVAGLYDLTFDEKKNLVSPEQFREELKTALHPKDHKLAEMLFLPYDNNNLIAYLTGEENEYESLGNYSVEDFDEQVSRLNSIVPVKDNLPEYMVKVIVKWLDDEKEIDPVVAEKMLTEGYYEMVINSKNRFLRRWYEYQLNFNNIFALRNSQELGVDAADQIVGSNDLAHELRAVSRRKGETRVPPEPDYATELFTIATETSFIERELKSDMTRWEYINDLIFFEYFTIDYILGYTTKLLIADRWRKLDRETGEKVLLKLVSELKEVKVEEEA